MRAFEPPTYVGRTDGGLPVETIKLGSSSLRSAGVAGEITGNDIAGFPENLCGLEIGHCHLDSGDVARHCQGKQGMRR